MLFRFFVILILFFLENPLIISQIDNHIDQSEFIHIYPLTISRHTKSPFSSAKAQTAFSHSNEILQRCDNVEDSNQDVACQVQFEFVGAIDIFDDDKLEVITTQEECDAIFGLEAGDIRVVNAIMYCGEPGDALGCAAEGSSMIIVNTENAQATGELIVHEFGHTKGLDDRDVPGNPIMHSSEFGGNEVSQIECMAYHRGATGGKRYKPVDIALLIDDTGSQEKEIERIKDAFTKHATGENCDKVQQLITFKDDVTAFEPTTNLLVLANQVNSLIASEGGDCPEAGITAIEKALEKVKDGGKIYLFTDAATEKVINASSIASEASARNISIYPYVSGECDSELEFTLTNDELINSSESIVISNNDKSTENSNATIQQITTLSRDAVETYSFLAEQTGGIFQFIPQIESGNPKDELFYENVVFNTLVGATGQAIVKIESSLGPRGSTLAVRIRGLNTQFGNNTNLSFSGSGITLNNLSVISPTEIIANISISNLAALGFREITATTNGEGATGVGIFEVVETATNPVILSLSKSSATQGEILKTTVFGQNTHFNNNSEVSLGSGINILNTVVVNAEEIEVELEISTVAITGFRDVTVTTGAEVATESIQGPFMVTYGTCSQIKTIAGKLGIEGSLDGIGTEATFNYPTGITVDPLGNLFIADQFNHIIRKITPNGVVSTFAGLAGEEGKVDGDSRVARFNLPAGLVTDKSGNIYVTERANRIVRKITQLGQVTTFAGSGEEGFKDGRGTLASFGSPTGITIDDLDNLYVVDQFNHIIRKITPDGNVTTIAGTAGLSGEKDGIGTSAMFRFPRDIVLAPDGTMYVTDFANHIIRKITPSGEVSTFAGSGLVGSSDGRGTIASFNFPHDITIDKEGNLYVTDVGNYLIRKITPSGEVSAFAGSGSIGGSDGKGTAAVFSFLGDITIDVVGNFYIADVGNHSIRKMNGCDIGLSSSCKGELSRIVNNSVIDEEIVAAAAISTEGEVNSFGEVTFQAGNSVILTEGFYAYGGFTAKIGDCNSTNSARKYASIEETQFYSRPNLNTQKKVIIQIVPNPVRYESQIFYQLPKETRVRLSIQSLQGIEVSTLISNTIKSAGRHQVTFRSQHLPTGLYVVSVQTEESITTEKMLISK